MIPTISGAIDHVHVYVPSRHEAAKWYHQNLGFTVVEKFAPWATDEGGPLTITDEGNNIHFALFRSQEAKPISLAFGCTHNEFNAWKLHLLALGLPFSESDHGLSHSVYFNDPFGNQLEITTYEVA